MAAWCSSPARSKQARASSRRRRQARGLLEIDPQPGVDVVAQRPRVTELDPWRGITHDTEMRVVMDTNVLVAALRSDQGASFQLLSLVGVTDKFQICLSVPLVLEYEDVLGRGGMVPNAGARDVEDLIDYLCSVASTHGVFFLWRPVLRDPKAEMVLELAVGGGCDAIVTFNRRDFAGAEGFDIQILSPGELLHQIGELE